MQNSIPEKGSQYNEVVEIQQSAAIRRKRSTVNRQRSTVNQKESPPLHTEGTQK
jgi:hypothetical protein